MAMFANQTQRINTLPGNDETITRMSVMASFGVLVFNSLCLSVPRFCVRLMRSWPLINVRLCAVVCTVVGATL